MTIERIILLGQPLVVMAETDYLALLEGSAVDNSDKPLRGEFFGRFIGLARKNANLSQAILAERCGWSQPFQSAVERGAYGLSPVQFAKALKVMKISQPSPEQLRDLLSGKMGPNRTLVVLGSKPNRFVDAEGKPLKVGNRVVFKVEGSKQTADILGFCSNGVSPLEQNPDLSQDLAPLGDLGHQLAKFDQAIVRFPQGKILLVKTRLTTKVLRQGNAN